MVMVLILASAWGRAQTRQEETSSLGLSDLPSVDAKSKIPALDEPAPTPDASGISPQGPDSTSIPKLRPPDKDMDKKAEQDWAAQAMLKKKEETKKKEQEQAALAEQKDKEAQQTLEKEKKEKQEEAAKASRQPTVAKPAASGFSETDAAKLPSVTGLDGVKPRAQASGDGRVQPGFDGFSGPSATSPMGKDFQSGAKPIMPGTSSADGRMQVPLQAPEPPSGAYKRISQDPNSFPPGYGEKKPLPPPPAKTVSAPPNPDPGDTKKIDLKDTRAGYSPYDNTKRVPDPRSQRRF